MEKTAIRFEPELKAEIQNMMGEANATSMADFVRQATEFYIAYLRQKKSIDFLAPLLAQTIKNEIESVERNVSQLIYKLAVEQAIANNIVACYNGEWVLTFGILCGIIILSRKLDKYEIFE